VYTYQSYRSLLGFSAAAVSLAVFIPAALAQTPREKLLVALCSEDWISAIAAVDMISLSEDVPGISIYRERLVRISEGPRIPVPIQDCVKGRSGSASVSAESVRRSSSFQRPSTISESAIDASNKPHLQRTAENLRSAPTRSSINSEAVNRARSSFGR
jgi:hypothetical protein